jgi:hypothetical protein
MNFHLHVSPQRSQTDVHNAMARTPLRFSNPSLSNYTKSKKLFGREGFDW